MIESILRTSIFLFFSFKCIFFSFLFLGTNFDVSKWSSPSSFKEYVFSLSQLIANVSKFLFCFAILLIREKRYPRELKHRFFRGLYKFFNLPTISMLSINLRTMCKQFTDRSRFSDINSSICIILDHAFKIKS